ncbi:MAG: M48 metallopeptidase family protein [Acidimicrobiales bacterium]
MQVEVVRSAKRQRTVQARRIGDLLRVSIPATMSKAEEDLWVARMLERVGRRASTDEIALAPRALALAARHRLPEPCSIRWVDNQESRWGSCTPRDGSIRISSRLAKLPGWVLDYVIVHELAHLAVTAHDASFWALVERYPRAERARGYLMAVGAGADLD